MKRNPGQSGFTLVEVLVALLLMAILTAMAWQGLDGVLRAREASREVVARTTRLATVLMQWEQDLQAVYDTGVVPSLAFDGHIPAPDPAAFAYAAVVIFDARAPDTTQRRIVTTGENARVLETPDHLRVRSRSARRESTERHSPQ